MASTSEQPMPAALLPESALRTRNLGRSLAERIAAELRDAILTGEIGPGAKLNQLRLAEQLNVSTTPIREALRLLASQGLVRIDTYSGATVPVPSLDELTSLYRIRLALCPLVAQCVALRTTEDQLERARVANRQLLVASDDSTWLEANHRLHSALDEGIGDRRLSQLWCELSAVSSIYVTLSLSYRADARQGAHDEHARLIDAYQHGDPVSIEQVLVEHLTHTYEGCRDAMAAMSDQGQGAGGDAWSDGRANKRLLAQGERRTKLT